MRKVRSLFQRLVGLLATPRRDRDLVSELDGHLHALIDDNLRAGMGPDEARRQALLKLGGIETTKDTYRDRRGLPWLENLSRDVRYSVRTLRKAPGFALVSIVSLAIGIGANCAVFSLADTFLLRPLGVPRPGELLTVGSTSSLGGSLLGSYRDYVDLRDLSKSFEGLAPFTEAVVVFAPAPGAVPKQRIGMLVSSEIFKVAGVTPELGRGFRPEEDQVPGRDAVVVLSHDFWEREFGADPSVVGRIVRLNGIDFTVVGVAPAGFTGLTQFTRTEFYAPLMMWPRLEADATLRRIEARDSRNLMIKARLKPGVTMAQAQAELAVIAADLERAYPDTNRNRQMAVRTETQNRIANGPPAAVLIVMLTLLASAVLFVSCANVAGLLASRAPVRAREIGLRLAIGAGRGRVMQQLITESVLLAIAGGVAGLGVGYAAVALFSRFQIPTDLPIVAAFELDRRALIVSLVVSLASAILFGLAPAIRSSRADLTAVMKATGAADFGQRRRWGRALLVGGQVAISVVLLVVATVVYRGFQRQIGSGPGFRVDHLLMMSLTPSQLGYSEARTQQFFERLAEQASLVPGVKSAALTRYMPMDGSVPAVTIVPEGFQFPRGRESAAHWSSIVDEHYFDTIGLPILRGRGFRATDSAGAPKVAVVNEVLAERYWPGQDPVGKRFRLDNSTGPWVQVVGVAKTSKYSFAIEPPTEFVYLPYRQRPSASMFLLAESTGDPASLATPLREVVRRLDADLPIANVRTMTQQYRLRTVVVLDIITTMIGAMGMMGMTLAIVGLYGLVAYAASRRTKEIGIRMAIGADQSDVLRMVLRHGMGLALAGLGAGLLASAVAARAMARVFPGGPAGDGRTDLVAFPLVAAAVLAVTLVAAYIPARRASRINPTEALRSE